MHGTLNNDIRELSVEETDSVTGAVINLLYTITVNGVTITGGMEGNKAITFVDYHNGTKTKIETTVN